MENTISIAGRTIGTGEPVYVIAELSANHNQDFEKAIELVNAAHACGADAIKLQTYTADTLTIDCDNPYFQISGGTLWDGKNLYQLYQQAFTPWEWQAELKQKAEELGMHCFSTPFDHSAVEFLERLNVPAYKIASFEIVDIPLIESVAKTGKPVIMSTGMATLEEIELAVSTLRNNGCNEIVLLKCTSAYPAKPEDMNLRTISELARRFDVPAGLSDHTLGTDVAIASVAIGASVIEKHVTLDRNDPGPDSAFSLEPHEFKHMVESVRCVEKALGKPTFGASEKEQASRKFRKSLFVVKDIRKGEQFTSENVRSIRPGQGLPPRFLNDVIGCIAAEDIQRGTPLSMTLVEGKLQTLNS
jgi:pseudaminic acid synthase